MLFACLFCFFAFSKLLLLLLAYLEHLNVRYARTYKASLLALSNYRLIYIYTMHSLPYLLPIAKGIFREGNLHSSNTDHAIQIL